MNLTEHFSLSELTNSGTAIRLGIDNTPSQEIVENLKTNAVGLEMIRAYLSGNSIHVNDGFRCEDLERILCKKDFTSWCSRHSKLICEESWKEYFVNKAHPKGYATDFVCPAFGTPLQIVKKIASTDIVFDQLIQEGTWVHASFAPAQRRQVLTAVFLGGSVSYSKGA